MLNADGGDDADAAVDIEDTGMSGDTNARGTQKMHIHRVREHKTQRRNETDGEQDTHELLPSCDMLLHGITPSVLHMSMLMSVFMSW